MARKNQAAAQNFTDATADIDQDEAELAPAKPTGKKPIPAAAANASRERQARVYAKSQTLDHDLFKLKLAYVKKVLVPNGDPVPTEHVHYFHSIDSSGRTQENSNQVGGHYHPIEVSHVENGVPVVKCGPPMVWISKTVGKKTQRVAVPYHLDEHTHEMEYLGSQVIQLRKANTEAMALATEAAAKGTQVIPGVLG